MVGGKKRNIKSFFSTLDIEVNPHTGKLLQICIYDGKKSLFFDTWSDFFEWLTIASRYKKYQKFIAHNGGNFDWVSLVCSDDAKKLPGFEIVTSGSTIVYLIIRGLYKKVIFCDSFQVLKKSLRALGETFDVPVQKGEIDYNKIEEIYNSDKQKFMEYLERDCISLFQICHKFMEIMNIDFWPITISSFSLYKFRREYLQYNLFRVKHKDEEFIAKSYAGGRTECFRQGEIENINVYDINSLYPSAMVNLDIPISMPVETDKFYDKLVGFYEIEFNQVNHNIPPIFWEKTENGLEFMYKGQGIFSWHEIKLGYLYNVDIKIKKGIIFPKSAKIFKKFIIDLYSMRQKYKGTALDLILKLVLNSQYGKYAQKEEVSSIEKWTPEVFKSYAHKNDAENGFKWSIYDEERGLFIITRIKPCFHRLIHISSLITSKARCIMYQFLAKYAENLYYCDTDSLHINCTLDDQYLHNSELGKFKFETSGRGIYVGRKQYAVGSKIKFKGIPLKSNLPHDKLCINDLKNILNGDIITFKYSNFPKLKSVLKSIKDADLNVQQACKLSTFIRKLKKPDFTSNFLKGE